MNWKPLKNKLLCSKVDNPSEGGLIVPGYASGTIMFLEVVKVGPSNQQAWEPDYSESTIVAKVSESIEVSLDGENMYIIDTKDVLLIGSK